MPRQRSITDAAIILHACRLLADRGAEAVTFAQVSALCGLAPPTLVQRFGTRDSMLGAMAEGLAGLLADSFAPDPSPLSMLRNGLQASVGWIRAALELGPVHGADRFSLELRKQVSYLLAAAVEAGELPHCDVAQLARTIQISVVGAVAVAGLEHADAAAEVGRAVELQLASYV